MQAVGMAHSALDRTLTYAKERLQFGRRLVDMAMLVEAARLFVYKTAWYIDQGGVVPELSSMAKTFASKVALKAVNEAL